MADPNQEHKQSTTTVLARYSQIAFVTPAAIVAGLLMGKLLDYWLHTHWLFVVGASFGAIAGFVGVVRMINREKSQSAMQCPSAKLFP